MNSSLISVEISLKRLNPSSDNHSLSLPSFHVFSQRPSIRSSMNFTLPMNPLCFSCILAPWRCCLRVQLLPYTDFYIQEPLVFHVSNGCSDVASVCSPLCFDLGALKKCPPEIPQKTILSQLLRMLPRPYFLFNRSSVFISQRKSIGKHLFL